MFATLKKAKTKSVTVKVKNEKDWASEYVCNVLEPGLVSYEDVGCGIAMLRKETIVNMMNTFIGKPVIISHIDVTPDNYKEHAVGYVTKVWYDDVQNWMFCSFIITDDKAKEKISRGYSVSCAYDVLATGKGGEWHAIKFDEEITEGTFTHLALVPNPRYEECKIEPCMMLVNSKKAVIKHENDCGHKMEMEEEKENDEDQKENHHFTFDFAEGAYVRFRIKGKQVSQKGEVVHIRHSEEEPLQVFTVRAEDGLTYELRVLKGTPQNFESLVRENKKEDKKMIQLFVKKNSKAGASVDPNDPTKQKWQARDLFVKVENEYVCLADLAKFAKENDFIAIDSVENEIEIDGVTITLENLVNAYRSSKQNEDEEDDKKENESEEDKENEDEEDSKENEELPPGQEKSEEGVPQKGNKKNEDGDDDEKENESDEDEKENDDEEEEETIKKENKKKDVSHFVKLNSLSKNNIGAASTPIYDTMQSRLGRGAERYGTEK